MNRLDNALSSFKDGFNCSQTVLTAFSESFGLDRETALRVAQAFGGGMVRMAETCGAVTGAFMDLVSPRTLSGFSKGSYDSGILLD